MSRKRNALWGFIVDIGGTGVVQAVTFIVTPLYLDFTSEELYGYWLTINSILSWLYLSDLGVGIALSRHAITAIENGNRDLLYQLIRNSLVLFLGISIVFLAIGIGMTPLFLRWFDVDDAHVRVFLITYLTAIFTGTIALTLSVYSAVIEAHQKIAFNRTVTSMSTLLGTIATIVFLFLDLGLIAFSLGMLLTALSAAIASYIYFLKLCPGFRLRPLKLQRHIVGKLMGFGGYFQLGKLANVVALNSPNIVIASVLGAALVSSYTFTTKIAMLFSVTVMSKVASALFPGVSQLMVQNHSEKLERTFMSLLRISMRIGIISATFILVANETFVRLWVGAESYSGDEVNLVWVFLVCFDSVVRGTSIFVFSFADLKGWSIVCLIEAVLNISVTLLLVNEYGLVGVALGGAISRVLSIGIYLPWFLKSKLSFSWSSFLKNVAATILKSLPGVIIVILLSRVATEINPWIWIVSMGFLAFAGNVLFFEIPYLMRLNVVTLRERIMALRSYY